MRTHRAQVGRVFHALSDPTRRDMIERLSEGPLSVSQLAKPLGVTLAAVVQHLQVLQASALVHTEKRGRTRLCRLESAGLTVIEQWIRGLLAAEKQDSAEVDV